MASFQIKLCGVWSNYESLEDEVLKHIFKAGYPAAEAELRGQRYAYDFSRMVQRNVGTGRERRIRPPYGWKAAPMSPSSCKLSHMWAGLPKSSAATIYVPHPLCSGEFIAVKVMRHGVPREASGAAQRSMSQPGAKTACTQRAEKQRPSCRSRLASIAALQYVGGRPKRQYSRGEHFAAGLGGAAAVIGGALLGVHLSGHGVKVSLYTKSCPPSQTHTPTQILTLPGQFVRPVWTIAYSTL
eukprot:TRINITY_DN20141_c0_g1_i3.p1 TRINITY_DN20141_c0_g1~~TRINITY_DN20141_c0_g1_i3.p1  ORF type:complete len:241 (+),score=25.04 TRINITY_DN20141_c0_g1_i3:69-791(+)